MQLSSFSGRYIKGGIAMYESEYNEKGGFYMMPRQLFSEKCPLSLEAKVLYTLLIDRTNLSLKNDLRDKKGKLFVYFTVEEAAKMLGCGVVKAGSVLAELVHQEYITKKRQGLGKPNLIYLNRLKLPPMSRTSETLPQSYIDELLRPSIPVGLDIQNLNTNYTNNNLN